MEGQDDTLRPLPKLLQTVGLDAQYFGDHEYRDGDAVVVYHVELGAPRKPLQHMFDNRFDIPALPRGPAIEGLGQRLAYARMVRIVEEQDRLALAGLGFAASCGELVEHGIGSRPGWVAPERTVIHDRLHILIACQHELVALEVVMDRAPRLQVCEQRIGVVARRGVETQQLKSGGKGLFAHVCDLTTPGCLPIAAGLRPA